jgi:hypothetical protein
MAPHAHGHGSAATEKRAQGIQEQYKLRYDCDVSKLSPAIAAKWIPLDFDEQSQQFVNNSLTNPWSGRWCSIRGQLAQWVGRYNADGVLNMSNMFVLSTTAWGKLLGQDAGAAKGRLIDVGAGDGRPTDQVRCCATTDAHRVWLQAASFFDHVAVTEASGPLSWRLWWRGYATYRTISLRGSQLCDNSYDVVSCLNVLDRRDSSAALFYLQCANAAGADVTTPGSCWRS